MNVFRRKNVVNNNQKYTACSCVRKTSYKHDTFENNLLISYLEYSMDFIVIVRLGNYTFKRTLSSLGSHDLGFNIVIGCWSVGRYLLYTSCHPQSVSSIVWWGIDHLLGVHLMQPQPIVHATSSIIRWNNYLRASVILTIDPWLLNAEWLGTFNKKVLDKDWSIESFWKSYPCVIKWKWCCTNEILCKMTWALLTFTQKDHDLY